MKWDTALSHAFILFGCLALLGGTLGFSGYVQGFPVNVPKLDALRGWYVHGEPSGNEPYREWTASKGTARISVNLRRCPSAQEAREWLRGYLSKFGVPPPRVSSPGTES